MPVRWNDTFIPVDGHMVGSQRNEHTVGPYNIDKGIRRENQSEKNNYNANSFKRANNSKTISIKQDNGSKEEKGNFMHAVGAEENQSLTLKGFKYKTVKVLTVKTLQEKP